MSKKVLTVALPGREYDIEIERGLLSRAGVTRITTAAHMSEPFLGECHDGEYPLRRYLRLVDAEAPL